MADQQSQHASVADFGILPLADQQTQNPSDLETKKSRLFDIWVKNYKQWLELLTTLLADSADEPGAAYLSTYTRSNEFTLKMIHHLQNQLHEHSSPSLHQWKAFVEAKFDDSSLDSLQATLSAPPSLTAVGDGDHFSSITDGHNLLTSIPTGDSTFHAASHTVSTSQASSSTQPRPPSGSLQNPPPRCAPTLLVQARTSKSPMPGAPGPSQLQTTPSNNLPSMWSLPTPPELPAYQNLIPSQAARAQQVQVTTMQQQPQHHRQVLQASSSGAPQPSWSQLQTAPWSASSSSQSTMAASNLMPPPRPTDGRRSPYALQPAQPQVNSQSSQPQISKNTAAVTPAQPGRTSTPDEPRRSVYIHFAPDKSPQLASIPLQRLQELAREQGVQLKHSDSEVHLYAKPAPGKRRRSPADSRQSTDEPSRKKRKRSPTKGSSSHQQLSMVTISENNTGKDPQRPQQ